MITEDAQIAVIAPRDEALPFLAIGAAVFFTESSTDARDNLKDCALKGFPVILVSDDYLPECSDIVQEYAAVPIPAITALPGKSGTAAFSTQRLYDEVKRAIGIDIEGLGKK